MSVAHTFDDVIRMISRERQRQEDLHGHKKELWQNVGIRLAVLTEEVGEVAAAIQDGNTEDLRRELVQVAAVAIKWLESLEVTS